MNNDNESTIELEHVALLSIWCKDEGDPVRIVQLGHALDTFYVGKYGEVTSRQGA